MYKFLQNGALSFALVLGGGAIASAGTITGTVDSTVRKFTPQSDESSIKASNAVSVSFGDTTIYIGTYQRTSVDQDVIIASYTNGVLDWMKADYETSGPDSRGLGLVWDGADALYAVMTIDGGVPLSGNGFERFTQGGWLPNYGSGGGAAVSVVLKLNPLSGLAETGTYITAKTPDAGQTNSLRPTGISLVNDSVVFEGDSFFSPLDEDRDVMSCVGGSPFDYRAVFASDLSEALSSEAIGCDDRTAFTDLETIVGSTSPAPAPSPSPSPAPAPSPSPSPAPAPSPSPSPAPAPSPSPAPAPSPSPSPAPAPSPSPSPAPAPSPSPAPAPSPSPAPAPSPSPAPAPSPSPSPTAAPIPAPSPTATPDPESVPEPTSLLALASIALACRRMRRDK